MTHSYVLFYSSGLVCADALVSHCVRKRLSPNVADKQLETPVACCWWFSFSASTANTFVLIYPACASRFGRVSVVQAVMRRSKRKMAIMVDVRARHWIVDLSSPSSSSILVNSHTHLGLNHLSHRVVLFGI